MLRQQLEKSMLDRNYVQLERVKKLLHRLLPFRYYVYLIRMPFKNILR